MSSDRGHKRRRTDRGSFSRPGERYCCPVRTGTEYSYTAPSPPRERSSTFAGFWPEYRGLNSMSPAPVPPLQHRQVPVHLERGDVAAVLVPLRPLVAQEEVEDTFAEGVAHQLGRLHHRDRARQRIRQRVEPELAALLRRELRDVVARPDRQLVALLDAVQPGGEEEGEREVRVAGRIRSANTPLA